jgi:hypothetical protein
MNEKKSEHKNKTTKRRSRIEEKKRKISTQTKSDRSEEQQREKRV